jgi:hypothetical protein
MRAIVRAAAGMPRRPDTTTVTAAGNPRPGLGVGRHVLASRLRLAAVAVVWLAIAGCKQQLGERCQLTRDCAPGLVCKVPSDTTCALGGTCRAPEAGDRCTTDADCPDGRRCVPSTQCADEGALTCASSAPDLASPPDGDGDGDDAGAR